jgi:nitrate/nitrite-specific signal transduction histidine kinase
MSDSKQSKLSQRINRLRWLAPVLAFLLVLFHQILEHTWLVSLPRWSHFATQLFFYGLLGPLLVWWALTSLWHRAKETESAQQALEATHRELSEANQRLEFLIRVNRRLAEADDEDALVELLLELPLEVVPAVACSLIRFDERGQPRPAIHQGNVEPEILETWSAHLSTHRLQQECAHCATHQANEVTPCPLLAKLSETVGAYQIYCLALTRGEREYGVLNIYLLEQNRPDERVQSLLETLATEMSLALESQQLRSRELAALYRLQQARRLSSLQAELTDVLEETVKTFEIEGGALFLSNPESGELNLLAESGPSLAQNVSLIKGLVKGAQQNREPLLISDLKQEGNGGQNIRALLILSLHSQEQPVAVMGSMVLWSARPNAFTRRQVRLARAMAVQLALRVENHRLYLQAEHQAALAERARLAREIHDGLAQTLSYLKLRTARIAKWLDEAELDRARTGLVEAQQLLTDAYVDAREAIDGLRLKPGGSKLNEWLVQALTDFQSLTTIQVEADLPLAVNLSPEVQSQLLRIIQEALSNVRKHADATRVRLDWQVDEQWLTLRIADNGHGFEPDDVPLMTRHGLKIMQERAELLDADFQIISRFDAGTQVVVRLPLESIQQESKPNE